MNDKACGIMVVASFLALLVSDARSHEQHSVRKYFDCGSFSVESLTVLTHTSTIFSEAYKQQLQITNKLSHHIYQANLDQHVSHTDGKQGWWLDAIASEANCFHPRYGYDYLIVQFACWNTQARTCSTGMGSPNSEWTQIYDSRRRGLTGGQQMTDQDQKRPDALGLQFRLWQQLPDTGTLW